MLAGAAGHDHHEVVGRDTPRHVGGGRAADEALGRDHGEAGEVLGAEAVEPHARTLPEPALEVGLRPAGGRDGVGVLGAEDHDRLAAEVDVVAAGRGGRAGERPQQRLGRRRPVIVDVVRRLGADDRHRARARREPALDRQRRPRRGRLVLGQTVAELAGVAQRRAILEPRTRAADVLRDQAHRAADDGVGAMAVAERVGTAGDSEADG